VDEGGQAAHGRALDHEVERLALLGGHLGPGRDRVLEQGKGPARPQDPAQLPEGLAVVEGVDQRLHGVGAVEALVRERQLAVVQAVEPQRAGQAQPRRLGPGPPQVGLEQVDPVDLQAEAGAQADGQVALAAAGVQHPRARRQGQGPAELVLHPPHGRGHRQPAGSLRVVAEVLGAAQQQPVGQPRLGAAVVADHPAGVLGLGLGHGLPPRALRTGWGCWAPCRGGRRSRGSRS
jgi:hypothetical protein